MNPTQRTDPNTFGWRDLWSPTLSLFTSTGTLVCCALPALFVTLGAGATLVGLLNFAPWLITLSKYSGWFFGVAGVMLTLAGIQLYRARNMPCPVDPKQARACRYLRTGSWWIYGFSVSVYAVGFFFAFLAQYLLL